MTTPLFPQPEYEFINKPVKIDLSNVPFGREMSFYIDSKLSQPRKYLHKFNGEGKSLDPNNKNGVAEKITIPLNYINYGAFNTEIYSYYDDGKGVGIPPNYLQCVNARGRGTSGYRGNFKGPYINGYRNSGWRELGNNTFSYNHLNAVKIDDDLVDLDREFLRNKDTNFIYYMIEESDFLWFYYDTDGKTKPMMWKNNYWKDGIWEEQIIPADGSSPAIRPVGFTVDRVKNLNPIWSAFSLVRRYVSWAYFMIQNVENVNLSRGKPVSIGDPVYMMLDLEHFYNGWWNGPPDLGYGQTKGKQHFFDTSTAEGRAAESEYLDRLSQVLDHTKQILLDPKNYIQSIANLDPIPEFILEFWTDLPDGTYVGEKRADGTKISPTFEQFLNLWAEYIEMLPEKYRTNFKIGVYAIPDVYEIDFDNSKDDNVSGGWYGEDLVPPVGSPAGAGRLWNWLSQGSRDKLNDLYIEKYKRLLDSCDFLSPQVYVFDSYNRFCDFTGGTNPQIQYDFYFKQEGNRNQFEQFTYDNIRRAILYNKKYGHNKPILPILSSVYPSSWEFTNLYNIYAKRGPYNKDIHSIPGNNNFITDRFIDLNTLKAQLKSCYDAVDNPSYITGFLWWNSGIPRIVDKSGDLNPFLNGVPFSTGDISGEDESRRRRRIYSLDVDTSTQDSIESLNDVGCAWIFPEGNLKCLSVSPWSDKYTKKHKQKTVRKELQLLNNLNNSILQTNRIGTIPTAEDRTLIINLSDLIFARETNFKSDNFSINVHPQVYSSTGGINNKIPYQTSDGKTYNLPLSLPNSSGYFYSWKTDSSPKSGQKIYNPDLLALDRLYLNSKQNNIIYCTIGDYGQEWAYNDPSDRTDPTKITDNINNLTPEQLKSLDSFWSAFLIARRYINWCYEIISKIENKAIGTTSNPAKSIGDTIYLLLNHEYPFLQWWNGLPKYNKDVNAPNRFFEITPSIPTESLRLAAETVYGEKLGEILDNIRSILQNPEGVLGLAFPIPTSVKKYMSHPVKSDTNFISEWSQIVNALPDKYKNVKIGVYNIPNVGAIDTDGVVSTKTTGFQGEGYQISGSPKSTNEAWNVLNAKSREIINTALVNKYSVILNKVDFLAPKLYAFEPTSQPLTCTKVYNFYTKNQSTGLDLMQQYTQDSIQRVVLYNTLYRKSLPIFPVLSTAYEYDSNGSVYTTYCGNSGYPFGGAWYHSAEFGFPNRDQYIWGRLIDYTTLSTQIKLCYDTVLKTPTQIKGFFWSNNAIPKAVSVSNNTNVYSWSPDIDSPTSYYRYRRYYADDYGFDTQNNRYTIDVWGDENNVWGLSLADDKKVIVAKRDIDIVNSIHDLRLSYGYGSVNTQA